MNRYFVLSFWMLGTTMLNPTTPTQWGGFLLSALYLIRGWLKEV